MSDPRQSAADPPVPEAPAPKRAASPTRWLDRLSALLLCVAAGGAIAAAAPSLLGEASPRLPAADTPEAEPLDVSPPPATRPPPALQFTPDDDEPRLTELERLYPDGMWPGHRSSGRPGAGAQRTEAPSIKPRAGRARAPLTIRADDDAAARTVGRVPKGERVLVIRELGEWALVMHHGADGVVTGWTTRRDLTIP